MASRRSKFNKGSIVAAALASSVIARDAVHAAPLGPAATPDAGPPAPASDAGGPPPGTSSAAPPSGPVSDTLTVQLIAATMEPLRPTLAACMRRESGTVVVAMLVRSDGSVQNVSASGPFNAAALGCIETAIQAARFAPFRAPPANVTLRLALP